jgi:hypothetical protein
MIHSHKHLNPGEACATCLIEARENGMDNKKWLMGTGALVVVGGAIGYYLHTRGKKDSVSTPPTTDLTLTSDSNNVALTSPEAIAKLTCGNSLKTFLFGQTIIYQYGKEGVAQIAETADRIGSYSELQFDVKPNSLPIVPRLGLASDVGSLDANFQLSTLKGLVAKSPMLARLRVENKQAIAQCLGNKQDYSFYQLLINNNLLDATIKVLVKMVSKADSYWKKRASHFNQQGAEGVKQCLYPLDIQRLVAAGLWALVQSNNPNKNALDGYMDKLTQVGKRLGLEFQYLYANVSPNSGLKTTDLWKTVSVLIQAFSDGIFNCENPSTDSFAIASPSIGAAEKTDSVETMLSVSGGLANAQILAGVVFYQTYNFNK